MGVGIGAVALNPGFWRGKRVLLTGHTGFKGAWAAVWLERLGAEVTGLALPPDQVPSLYELARVRGLLAAEHLIDLRDAAQVQAAVGARPFATHVGRADHAAHRRRLGPHVLIIGGIRGGDRREQDSQGDRRRGC